jgi:hypothetical protein
LLIFSAPVSISFSGTLLKLTGLFAAVWRDKVKPGDDDFDALRAHEAIGFGWSHGEGQQVSGWV